MTEKLLSPVVLEKLKIKFEYEVHANKGNFQECHTQEHGRTPRESFFSKIPNFSSKIPSSISFI